MSSLAAVLSDTHIPGSVVDLPPRVLPQRIFPYMEEVDLILHAGDIVKATLLDEIAAYAPVRAVRGDHDSDTSVAHLPEILEFEFGGLPVAMVHDSGRKEGRRNRLRRRFPGAHVVIFGHSHIPGIEDENGLLLLNPGDASSTFALLYVEEGNVYGEIVDLKNGMHRPAGYYPPLSTKRPKRAGFTDTTKKLLLEKARHRCQDCSSRESPEVAHIIPVSEGGRRIPENGIVLCHRCRVEKNNKDRCRKELDEYLDKEPTRIVPDRMIDWAFEHLSGLGASLPVQREWLYGLTVERLITMLREKEAEHLALDLVRGYLSGSHYKYYEI
jgi:putative phosphoesterase